MAPTVDPATLRRRRSSAFATALAAASCTATPIERPGPAVDFVTFSGDEYPGARQLLNGFDDRTDDAAWARGDRALLGLRLEKGAEVRKWLLDIETLHDMPVSLADAPPERTESGGFSLIFDPAATIVAARVHDASGALLTDTQVLMPTGYVARGVLPAIDRSRASADQPTPEQLVVLFRDQLRARYAIQALLNVVREDEALADYFWQVIEKPSVWSVVGNFGVDVDVDIPFEKSLAAQVPSPLPAVERAFAVPMSIRVNGSPALFIDLLVTDARRPYALCGGIVAAAARHPTEPGLTFRVQLLAARCGSPTTSGH